MSALKNNKFLVSEFGLDNLENLACDHHQTCLTSGTGEARSIVLRALDYAPWNYGNQVSHHNDRSMVRLVCSTKYQNETPLASLLQELNIEDNTTVLHSRRLG